MSARRLAALALLFPLAACQTGLAAVERPVSQANLIRSDGSVAGTVSVYQEPTGVLLRIDAAGLPPGPHGTHIHAVGRCDPPSFESAGSHWNPTNNEHGHRNPEGPHMGDLGNLGVGSDGRLQTGLLVPGAAMWPGTDRPALRDEDGAALVIHAQADDQVTDPSGNSGQRIACAVL